MVICLKEGLPSKKVKLPYKSEKEKLRFFLYSPRPFVKTNPFQVSPCHVCLPEMARRSQHNQWGCRSATACPEPPRRSIARRGRGRPRTQVWRPNWWLGKAMQWSSDPGSIIWGGMLMLVASISVEILRRPPFASMCMACDHISRVM